MVQRAATPGLWTIRQVRSVAKDNTQARCSIPFVLQRDISCDQQGRQYTQRRAEADRQGDFMSIDFNGSEITVLAARRANHGVFSSTSIEKGLIMGRHAMF